MQSILVVLVSFFDIIYMEKMIDKFFESGEGSDRWLLCLMLIAFVLIACKAVFFDDQTMIEFLFLLFRAMV